MRPTISTVLLSLVFFVACADEELPLDDLEQQNLEDEGDENFPWSAAPDLPDEADDPPKPCEPGSYNCICVDPLNKCDEGFSCIGGKCSCDFLGTLHCPCNIDECDDGLSCDEYGFCEP